MATDERDYGTGVSIIDSPVLFDNGQWLVVSSQ
jgi:hypothetical protein